MHTENSVKVRLAKHGCFFANQEFSSDVKFDNIADLQYDEMEDEEHPFVKYLEEDGISVEQLKP